MATNEVVNVLALPTGVLHISLNRPKQLNALNEQVLTTLSHLFAQAKQDRSIKALLLSGEGKAFCAGADINQLAALRGTSGLAFARFGQAVFRQLECLGKPSLAAIQGYAFGGGCELSMAASLRIAANNALFGQPEVKLGVIPGFGGTQRLSRLIGKGRALEIVLTGRRFTAEEAFQWGFVNELTAPEGLLQRATEMLESIIQYSPAALQSMLTVVDQGYDIPLEESLELEAAHFGICCTTADKEEGVKAFLEKRPPVFKGE